MREAVEGGGGKPKEKMSKPLIRKPAKSGARSGSGNGVGKAMKQVLKKASAGKRVYRKKV